MFSNLTEGQRVNGLQYVMWLQEGMDGPHNLRGAYDVIQLQMTMTFSSQRFRHKSGSRILPGLVVQIYAVFILTPTVIILPLISLCIGSFNLVWIGLPKSIFCISEFSHVLSSFYRMAIHNGFFLFFSVLYYLGSLFCICEAFITFFSSCRKLALS